MKEKIKIENFGGIKNVEFELRSINIIIGPQASGKSVSVKLIYFFKGFISEIFESILNNEKEKDLKTRQKEKFRKYFPKESWPSGAFNIQYSIQDDYIKIEKSRNKPITFKYSSSFKQILTKGKEIFKNEQNKIAGHLDLSNIVYNNAQIQYKETVSKVINDVLVNQQYFVPAGRSFFSNLQSNIYSFIKNNISIEPFMAEFGSFYENIKAIYLKQTPPNNIKESFDVLISEVIGGTFLREAEKDYIIHQDNRKVNLSHASSGQQEILPLTLILKVLGEAYNNATLYIEEPEAHLFPTAQKKVVQLLARTFNSNRSSFQIIITTHSPYILSSFNNLLEAGKIIEEQPNQQEKVFNVIPKEEVLHTKYLAVYSLFNGEKKNLIDKETKLISQNILDAVSDELSVNFGKLLDIEY